jgi:hypothetical protein
MGADAAAAPRPPRGAEEVEDHTDPVAPVRRRPLAPGDQLRQIKPERAPLIYGSLRPRPAAAAPLLPRPQAQAGRMTNEAVVPTGAHAETLMTTGVAVAGWRGLEREQRWHWFEQLYDQAARLDRRYRLALRTGWWEDEIQVELLAALDAWIGMFDHANWADPEAKPRLRFQLQRSASSCAAACSNSTQNATARRSSVTSAPRARVSHPAMFRDEREHDHHGEPALPPALEETIRAVICIGQPRGHRGPRGARHRRVLEPERRAPPLARDRTPPTHRPDAPHRPDRPQTGPRQRLTSATPRRTSASTT